MANGDAVGIVDVVDRYNIFYWNAIFTGNTVECVTLLYNVNDGSWGTDGGNFSNGRFRRIINIDDLRISPGRAEGYTISASFTAKTFLSKEPELEEEE